MSRRDITNREKLRLEEKEIDKQLKDAGLDAEGLTLEDKKGMLQMVEESKRCAQEEEDRRQKENQIYEETLSKSFTEKCDERGNNSTSSAGENAKDIFLVEVKPSEHITEQDEFSDSGSTTPDLFPSPAGTPARTASNYEQIPSGKSISKESPRSSQDLILFSQSSAKLGVEKKAIENCIESISVSESEDDEDNMSSSPSVVSSSLPSNSGVGNRLSSSPSARAPLRTSKFADICKSSSGIQHKEIENAKVNLQIPTVDTKPEIEETLMSPVIGQRYILPLKKADSTLVKEVSRVENVEMSDFICVKPVNPAESDLISDVYRSEPGTSSSNVHQNELTECGKQSSAEPTFVIEELPKKESHKRKCDVLEDDLDSNSRGTNKLCTSVLDGVSVKNSPKNTRKTPFLSLNLSDSDEDLNFLSKKEKKKCVNVFFIQDSDEVTLKRHSSKSEDPEKAYFKSKNESICSGYERILCLINKSYEKFEKYQSSLVGRMPWSAPIGIDRRVKDSLDRPRVPVKKRLDLPHSGDNEHPRMMTRNAPKSSILRDEYANLSDDSLPELASTSSGWIDAKKTSTKRRGMQLGLSRKQARFGKTPESDSKTTSPVVGLNVINESDSEDFDLLLPKKSSNLKKKTLFNSEGGANEGIVSRVSPSAQVEEQTNFEMGDILEDNQKSPVILTRESKESSPVNGKNLNLGSVCMVENDAQPSTSGIANKQQKRPRKTFRLSVESDEESSANSDRLVIVQDKSVVPSDERVQMLPKELLPVQSVSEQKTYGSPLRESKVSSVRKKEPLQFLTVKDVVSKDRLKTEEDDFENVHLVDRSECLPSTSKCSKTTTRARKGKGNSDSLKPGPLKLKTKRGRGAVKVESPEPIIEDQASPVLEIPHQDHINGLPENKIECPLCQRYFPLDKIEAHASDCVGPTEDDTTLQQPETNAVRTKTRLNNVKNDDIMMINESSDNGGLRFGRLMSSNSRRGRERTPPNHARCSFCSLVFKEGDEYFIHVEDCKSRFQTSSSMSSLKRSPGKLQTSYSASAVSSSPIKPRPPIGKGPSVLEQLEGAIAIHVHHGDITDAVYQNPTTAIVHIVNCIAVRPHGLSETLARKYPYCNTYKDRLPIGNLNRSRRADRGIPGDIKICRPHVKAQDPIVVDIYGQFYMGKAYNKNFTSKKLVSQMKRYKENGELSMTDGGSGKGRHATDNNVNEKYFDIHLLEGLQADTSENRIKWFKEALEKLAGSVAGEDIKTVVFPFGIGCGLAGGNWERDYYPLIKKFSNMLANQGVNIILVKKVEKTLSDQALAAAGTQKTSSYGGTKWHR